MRVRVGEKVGLTYNGGASGTVLGPAIVLAVRETPNSAYKQRADFRMQHGDVMDRPVHGDWLLKKSQCEGKTLEVWEPIWERLAAPEWEPPTGESGGK